MTDTTNYPLQFAAVGLGVLLVGGLGYLVCCRRARATKNNDKNDEAGGTYGTLSA